jgi:hypothetical protein
MNLGQMDFQSLVETMTGMVLVATVALFSYEVFKPPVVYAQDWGRASKRSALAPATVEEGAFERLPAAPRRTGPLVIPIERRHPRRALRWAEHKTWGGE